MMKQRFDLLNQWASLYDDQRALCLSTAASLSLRSKQLPICNNSESGSTNERTDLRLMDLAVAIVNPEEFFGKVLVSITVNV
jgi:hypothetical protein